MEPVQPARGGLERPQPMAPSRQVTLLQRKPGKHGAGLGKTSGWVHRATLKMKNVEMLAGVNYERVTDDGLFVTFGPDRKDGSRSHQGAEENKGRLAHLSLHRPYGSCCSFAAPMDQPDASAMRSGIARRARSRSASRTIDAASTPSLELFTYTVRFIFMN